MPVVRTAVGPLMNIPAYCPLLAGGRTSVRLPIVTPFLACRKHSCSRRVAISDSGLTAIRELAMR